MLCFFLGKLTEFDRFLFEIPRGSLETGKIVISRAAGQVEHPTRFLINHSNEFMT